MQLNEAINHRRKALNMSVDDLVKESGVPKGTLSKITAGINANPTLSTVKAICNALGCTLNDLVCDIENSNEQRVPIIIDESDNNKQIELTKHEEKVIIAYRDKQEMQPAVDKLLGVEEIHTTPAIRAARSFGDKSKIDRNADIDEQRFIDAPESDIDM